MSEGQFRSHESIAIAIKWGIEDNMPQGASATGCQTDSGFRKVVAQLVEMQYHAVTVDNHHFGSGAKMLLSVMDET